MNLQLPTKSTSLYIRNIKQKTTRLFNPHLPLTLDISWILPTPWSVWVTTQSHGDIASVAAFSGTTCIWLAAREVFFTKVAWKMGLNKNDWEQMVFWNDSWNIKFLDSEMVFEISSNSKRWNYSKLDIISSSYGCFLKRWYPQITPTWSFLVGKPMVVGYYHFRKPPYFLSHSWFGWRTTGDTHLFLTITTSWFWLYVFLLCLFPFCAGSDKFVKSYQHPN